jgi:hypothetical protein
MPIPLKGAKEPVLHRMNFELLFLLHLKKGFIFPLDSPAKTLKDRK